MKREDRLINIYTQFDDCAKEFCDITDGIFFDISSEYIGAEKAENLKYRFAKIFYNSFYIKFKYTAHSVLSVTNSILECWVYLDKTDYAIPIPLPMFLDYCNITIGKPLVIPFITNQVGMIQAFNCIGDVLKGILHKIAEISYNIEAKDSLIKHFTDEMQYIFEVDCNNNTPVKVFEEFCNFFTARFSMDAFINLIKGNKAKAIKQLSKIKKITGYEKRIIKFLKSDECIEVTDLSEIIKNAETYNERGVQKANFKEFSVVFFSAFVMTLGISVLYLAIYFLLISIEGSNSFYLMGPIYGFPYCICCAFVTSIAVSYFTRFKFYKFLYKKSYEQYCEMDHVANGGGADKFMKVFLWVIVAASLILCILLSKWNINFLEDKFIDNSKFFSLKGNAYSYSDIERVYYKPNRINDFGETLDFPSYVLVLKNGEEIDFYEFDEIEKYENELLVFFQEKGIKIENNIK